MNVILYNNTSEKIAVNKSLTEVDTLTGALKNGTSIINPVLVIESNIEDLTDVNYVYIETFNRYYYVEDIRTLRTDLCEISLHVDVLMSYADQILSNTAIIRKQENSYNLYVNDGSFKVYQNPMVLTKQFPNGFNSWSYVLAVAGS